MTKRKVSNPLALAVLACLMERPMHPYEMATTLRERGKDQSIKLNYGFKEYTHFEAGLSLIPVLPPEDAAALLAQRCDRLELEISQERSLLQFAGQRGLPRLFAIEGEYVLAMREAELAWTRKLADEIKSGTLEGVAEWAAMLRARDDQENEAPQAREEREEEEQ